MKKNEVLELLKSKNRNFRLPKNVDFSIEDNILTIELPKEGLTSNMQTDEAAFEGWVICLKAWIPNIQKVIIRSQVKEYPTTNEHYNRFLYRVMKFIETYSWVEADEFKEEIKKFKTNKLMVNVPSKEAEKRAEHEEAILEREFCSKEKGNFDAIDHQLPVHLFNGKVGKKMSLTPSSFLDIWSIKENVLNIYELKLPKNKKVGIISELMFYVNVMTDIMTHNIIIPNTSVYRSFNQLYEMQEKNNCKQINGIFLASALHPMIEQRNEEVIAILNNGTFNIPTKFLHQTL